MRNNTTNEQKPYTGPVRYEWRDGREILVPAIEAPHSSRWTPQAIDKRTGRPIADGEAVGGRTPVYTYKKSLSEVLSQEDKTRFEELSTDEEK